MFFSLLLCLLSVTNIESPRNYSNLLLTVFLPFFWQLFVVVWARIRFLFFRVLFLSAQHWWNSRKKQKTRILRDHWIAAEDQVERSQDSLLLEEKFRFAYLSITDFLKWTLPFTVFSKKKSNSLSFLPLPPVPFARRAASEQPQGEVGLFSLRQRRDWHRAGHGRLEATTTTSSSSSEVGSGYPPVVESGNSNRHIFIFMEQPD